METKQTKILILYGGLCLVFAGVWLTRGSLELSEAFAPSDGSTITASCTDPTAASFTPDQTVTLSVSAPAAAAFNCTAFSFSIALTGAVNGDGNPSTFGGLACDSAGTVRDYWLHPNHKVAGLQCQSSTGSTRLSVAGDATDNSAVTIKMGCVGCSYSTITQVDHDATARTIYGPSGAVSSTEPSDGTSDDNDGAVNGEIDLGDRYQFHISVDFSNYNLSGDTEILTYSFTPL